MTKWIRVFALGLTCMLAVAPAADQKDSSKKVAPANKVDLNNATEAELISVPGIGAPTAKKIIAGRPFASVADLAKAGISPASIAKITPNVMVGPAQTKSAAAAAGAVAKSLPAPAATPAPAPKAAVPPAAPQSAAPVSKATGPTLPAQVPPGPGMVWVNEETKVYHKEGDRWFGRTKKGKFMNEPDAIKAGFTLSKEGAAKKKAS